MLEQFKKDMEKLKNPEKAKVLSRFFKTGKGEYGEGDNFLGIIVPEQRKVAKKFQNLNLRKLNVLLASNIHEYRLTALFILVDKYKKADEEEKQKIFEFYLKNTENISNWDLVDLSAPNIVGNYLLDKNKSALKQTLYRLAKSKSLWEKRIAVLATFEFIKNNKFDDALKISETLVNEKHDLIHKAVGWMLREIGKRDIKAEENFLKRHCKTMPRTMLRYAIKKFPEIKRKIYLNNVTAKKKG